MGTDETEIYQIIKYLFWILTQKLQTKSFSDAIMITATPFCFLMLECQ